MSSGVDALMLKICSSKKMALKLVVFDLTLTFKKNSTVR
jgi:hypothetical protein